MKTKTKNELLLIKVTPHRVGGIKSFKKLDGELATINSGEEGSFKGAVRVLPKRVQTEIGSMVSSVLNSFYRISLPWEDGGWRVVRPENYHKVRELVEKYRVVCEDIKSHLIENHDQLKADCKVRLGDAYVEGIFPEKEYIRKQMGISMNVRPAISRGVEEFHGLTDEDKRELESSIRESYESQFADAATAYKERLQTILNDWSTRLERKDQKGVRYKSMQNSAIEILEGLQDLNIFGDPEMDKVVHNLKEVITKADVDHIRDNEDGRKEVNAQMADINEALDNFDF